MGKGGQKRLLLNGIIPFPTSREEENVLLLRSVNLILPLNSIVS